MYFVVIRALSVVGHFGGASGREGAAASAGLAYSRMAAAVDEFHDATNYHT
jgi:hypothetical protein